MKSSFIKHINKYFEKLIEQHGFKKQIEQNEAESYSIDFCSDVFVIRLEKYRREFYITLYKIGQPDDEINLFNLLQYLNRNTAKNTEAKYFRDEDDIDECYRKQLLYISDIVYENLKEIDEFFSGGNYVSKVVAVNKFMMEKYPELFKKSK